MKIILRLLSLVVAYATLATASSSSSSSASLPEEEILQLTSACPLWAQEVLCEPIFGTAKTQTLKYRNRILSPYCPSACHACSSGTPQQQPHEEEDDYSDDDYDDYDEEEELEAEVDVGDVFSHCFDWQKPETADVWKPGDMDVMYQRILKDFPQYHPTILSMPASYHQQHFNTSSSSATANNNIKIGPWMIQLDHFLTPQEAEIMIEETRLEVMINGDKDNPPEDLIAPPDETGGVCHSTQAWCYEDCLSRPEIQTVIAKVENLVQIPWRYAEPIHFIEYTPQQKYGRHHDYQHEEAETMQGPRLFTLLMYLNTPPPSPEGKNDDNNNHDGGGQTCFDDIGVCIQPKLGRAVIWPNVLDDKPWEIENRTWHQADEITWDGYKYASTIWYHLRDYKHAKRTNCVYEADKFDELEDDETWAEYYYHDDEDV